ncbi:MAG: 1-aminocyclopropane-1-carboxylate deaminase/D-cysteine desulfhydrase [Gammaproteobacteria bacterium]|nr:1-aminocyclopropane-1-carboxylate deaminase/D-cysteine desulfhydrase [Gammaproteobacteria bacterium]
MSVNPPPFSELADSPMTSVTAQGQQIYIKRDDLLHPLFNGNKARKFLYYLYLQETQFKSIVSFGGNQSNAMLALSALAKLKGWKFEYYLKKLPQQLQSSPVGNFKQACKNGMKYHEVTDFPALATSADRLAIQQGGAEPEAEYGISMLANEINQWVAEQQMTDCCVFLPSGTGTTAFYLQLHTLLPVYTTPCIGNSAYLQKQWQSIKSTNARFPSIILPRKTKRFGQLDLESYKLWRDLLDNTGIEFDLLYDPVGWNAILSNRQLLAQNIIYIHCGGTSGNESMILRYNYLCKISRQKVRYASH